MPLSDHRNLSVITQEIVRRRPKSLLDLGAGMGLYGAIARQYLDIEMLRLKPEDWSTIIYGVEGFREYANPMWNMYTTVQCTDFSDPNNFSQYVGFDLVLMIDSLEHLDFGIGSSVLDFVISNNKRVVVSCPFGDCYLEQGAVFGNEMERHRHHWTPEDMRIRGGMILQEEAGKACFVATIPGWGQ